MSEEFSPSELFAFELCKQISIAREATRHRPANEEEGAQMEQQLRKTLKLAKEAALIIMSSTPGQLNMVQKSIAKGRVGEIAAGYMATLAEPLLATIAKCESEIERLFLVSFLAPTPALVLTTPADLTTAFGPEVEVPASATRLWSHTAANTRLPEPSVPVARAGYVYSARPVPLWLVPQYEIALPDRRVRVDFAIIPEAGAGCPAYAVELDGHDFHERTREQATNDKSRDRAMLAAGWQTLRFTGTELFADPSACVDQVRFAAFWESLRRNPAMAAKFQRGAA